jgi:chromosome segregation protein
VKLRKITLKGFKTFPRKTEIEYKEGINIIIGPNGSGKSNIVDAVKWALGEKSIKSLRGGNMDDVIFKGNDQGMLPSNFASVSMIFDNQDRKLRLDVDEVEIERAFSKDKASKFMINKKRAKLKEIVSLFADTGITSNSYAIIEQGKINNLLLSSSQEKRVIFEEAAGVMNEKFEKIETERKLDRAGENLQRIDDIIEEKDKHYGSLKRAVSKYNRYLQFKDNLNEKKRRYNGLNYLHFKEELEKFDEKRNPLFLKKAALLKEVSQLESELAELDLAITNIW